MYNILIPAGTLVQRDDSQMIRLACDVYVEAERNWVAGGCYDYFCAGHQWSVGSGCVRDMDSFPVVSVGYRHPEGLVVLMG